MSISLPSLDIRSLVSENEKAQAIIKKDFETNHIGFAENLAYHFATGLLSSIGENLKDPYFIRPSKTEPDHYYFYFNFAPENTGFNDCCYISRPCFNQVSTFNDTLIQSIKRSKLPGHSQTYYQGLMMRIARVAEKELIRLLKNYTSHPMHSMLKFAIELQKEDNLRLQISYWIDLEPLPLLLPPKKGFYITQIKNTTVQKSKSSTEQVSSEWKDF